MGTVSGTEQGMTQSRRNMLKWVDAHISQFKLDNECDDVDVTIKNMEGMDNSAPIGLTREMLEGLS